MSQVLYQDEWVTFSFDEAHGLVRYTRSAVPYGGVENVDRSFGHLRDLVAQVPRGSTLLIDIRDAPPRNDEAFEAKTNAALNVVLGRFVRHATLVRTAVGKLQTARLARARGAEAHVFEVEAEAIAYLLGT